MLKTITRRRIVDFCKVDDIRAVFFDRENKVASYHYPLFAVCFEEQSYATDIDLNRNKPIDTFCEIQLMLGDSLGVFSQCDDISNFLGYEYGEDRIDWSDSMRALIQKDKNDNVH